MSTPARLSAEPATRLSPPRRSGWPPAATIAAWALWAASVALVAIGLALARSAGASRAGAVSGWLDAVNAGPRRASTSCPAWRGSTTGSSGSTHSATGMDAPGGSP